ncbi:MAG: sporulation protein YtxC [Senegalia sp. (in: firmicutes)]|uniref:sporulation protein YtxC n=1 Tax=Senegalia sp. (in: firmicutes) TaxID=1924098 RepID=UPI003F9BB46A
MYCLTIEYDDQICDISTILNNRFKNINSIVDIKGDICKVGNLSKIRYLIKDKNKADEVAIKKIVNNIIASELVDLIISKYQYNMIKKEILNKKSWFQDKDINLLYNKSLDYIENRYENYNLITSNISKRANINKIILDYLNNNDILNIEGFINFRLEFLKQIIKNTVNDITEEFVVEKEFEDFINMLKYFVDIQTAKFETVNIFFMKNKRYLLYDENMRMINNEYLKEIADEMENNEMGYDDLLISSLITIAPNKVMIHLGDRKEDEAIKIIKNIFEKNVILCDGCNLCNIGHRIDIHRKY